MGGGGVTLFRVRGIRIGVDFSWFVVLFLIIFWLSESYRDELNLAQGDSEPKVTPRNAQPQHALCDGPSDDPVNGIQAVAQDRDTDRDRQNGKNHGRRQPKQEIGGVVQVREDVRDVWLTRWLRDFAYDLRYSARTFRN